MVVGVRDAQLHLKTRKKYAFSESQLIALDPLRGTSSSFFGSLKGNSRVFATGATVCRRSGRARVCVYAYMLVRTVTRAFACCVPAHPSAGCPSQGASHLPGPSQGLPGTARVTQLPSSRACCLTPMCTQWSRGTGLGRWPCDHGARPQIPSLLIQGSLETTGLTH